MDEFIEQQKNSNNPNEFFADFHGTAGDMEEAAKVYAKQEQQQQQRQQQLSQQLNSGPQLTEGSNLDNLFNRLGNLYSETQRQKNEQEEKKKIVISKLSLDSQGLGFGIASILGLLEGNTI